jgi:polysaccharide biosynthesis protein PelA
MLKSLQRWLSALVLFPLAICQGGSARKGMRWVVCYSDKPRPEEFLSFDLAVLDSDNHPPLALLSRPARAMLAYLSLGEVGNHHTYFEAVKAEGILLDENPNWPGSFFVDVRDARWARRVIGQLVPAILAAGFNGVFLDTLDDPAALESADPGRYRGMSAAAAHLVRALREAFPRIHIMVNRGYELMPEIAASIDGLLGESVYSTYDHAARNLYHRVPAVQYQQQVSLMHQALRWNPRLRLCSLDYWDPGDMKEIRHIYQLERNNGFAPYVATSDLDRIVRAP